MDRRARVLLKIAVWAVCLLPLASLGARAWTGNLTANPISYITNELGRTALKLLLASLAVTPLRVLTAMVWPVALRRLLGLFAFFYAALHLSVWVVLDHFFDWPHLGADIVKRPYITVGMTAFVLLLPLAATSTSGMIRRLGGARWRRLHRLAYVTAVLGVLHFVWLAKKGRMEPWGYATVLAVLLGVRVVVALRRRVLGFTGMRASVALLIGVLLGGCAVPGQMVGVTSEGPIREILPNGVVLISHEHRASDVVAVQLWVRVGGRDETPAELGLSHYMEHMLFKGTPTRPPGSIDSMLEGLGGVSNAFTSYDFVHYDAVVPASAVEAAAAMLADIAVNASFDPKELESEKKVVFEEIRLTEDDPERFLTRRLTEAAYPRHAYGRPLLGTPALVESLTRDALTAYYRKHYVPRNMVLVVVGAITSAQTRAVALRTIGQLTGPAPPGRVPGAPGSLRGGVRIDVPRPEQHAYLGLAWHAAANANTDIYAVDLLTYILGDGPSSRLSRVLRDERRLVETVESSYIAREQSGIVSVTARLAPADLEAAETAMLDVIRRVREQGVTEEERRRAIITAESAYAFDIETAEGLARSYGQAETTWTLVDELAYLSRLRQVTAAQIQEAARTYLRDDNYARVRFVPEARR